MKLDLVRGDTNQDDTNQDDTNQDDTNSWRNLPTKKTISAQPPLLFSPRQNELRMIFIMGKYLILHSWFQLY